MHSPRLERLLRGSPSVLPENLESICLCIPSRVTDHVCTSRVRQSLRGNVKYQEMQHLDKRLDAAWAKREL